jgi:hypothetical protein
VAYGLHRHEKKRNVFRKGAKLAEKRYFLMKAISDICFATSASLRELIACGRTQAQFLRPHPKPEIMLNGYIIYGMMALFRGRHQLE